MWGKSEGWPLASEARLQAPQGRVVCSNTHSRCVVFFSLNSNCLLLLRTRSW